MDWEYQCIKKLCIKFYWYTCNATHCLCDRAWRLWWWWRLWGWLRRGGIRPGRWVTSCVHVFRGGGGGIISVVFNPTCQFCVKHLFTLVHCDISGYWFCLCLTGRKTPSYLLVLFECVALLLIFSPGFNNPHPKRVVLGTLLILCNML